ncbi:MAG TPA: Hsp70 family protein, partial [Polyangiaceae bacterium LLY-WYZ-14_1]|nr:Hsp70 family protein [Polyangiaceae bacterium LLY-WYZ-14_1]
REYRPVHRVGRLRFLECTRLDAAGQPAGDLTPWAEVLFPYDPTLTDREPSTLAGEVGHRAPELGGEHIIETYAYDPDGRIEVTLENATRGYRRAYRL